jgi:hypothetical protein
MMSEPQKRMDDETASATCSPRRGSDSDAGELPVVLWWSNGDDSDFVSFPKARRLLGTCT